MSPQYEFSSACLNDNNAVGSFVFRPQLVIGFVVGKGSAI